MNTFCGNGSERTSFWIFFEGVVLQWQNGRHSNKPDLTSWGGRSFVNSHYDEDKADENTVASFVVSETRHF